jgi:hypothetical protein
MWGMRMGMRMRMSENGNGIEGRNRIIPLWRGVGGGEFQKVVNLDEN